MNRQLVGQAYLLSSVDYFWISTWACAILMALVWLTRRPGTGGGATVAAD
jgi:MFS transporter, DHA2 family, multidrug resistance protein